jgi:hypothetical protein
VLLSTLLNAEQSTQKRDELLYSAPVMSNSQASFLSKDGVKFLALATIVLMEYDIRASTRSVARRRIQLRDAFVDSLNKSEASKSQIATTSSLTETVKSLDSVAKSVSDATDIIAVLTELVVSNPWASDATLKSADFNETVRRIALAEIVNAVSNGPGSHGLQNDDPHSWTDDLLGKYFEKASRKMSNVKRRPKKWVYASIGAISGAAIGALLLAPHVGAAIGGSMGLAGAAGTSAGLALLGGGSIATGGLGMFGGTCLVAAASSAVGASAGAVTQELSKQSLDANQEAFKLVITIESLRRFGREDVVEVIRESLDRRVRDLASQGLDLSAKHADQKRILKEKLKAIDNETALLRAVVPSQARESDT